MIIQIAIYGLYIGILAAFISGSGADSVPITFQRQSNNRPPLYCRGDDSALPCARYSLYRTACTTEALSTALSGDQYHTERLLGGDVHYISGRRQDSI